MSSFYLLYHKSFLCGPTFYIQYYARLQHKYLRLVLYPPTAPRLKRFFLVWTRMPGMWKSQCSFNWIKLPVFLYLQPLLTGNFLDSLTNKIRCNKGDVASKRASRLTWGGHTWASCEWRRNRRELTRTFTRILSPAPKLYALLRWNSHLRF